ncbi:MAG: hypothetical protein ABJB85_07710 [Nitrososphaerota archaeon]
MELRNFPRLPNDYKLVVNISSDSSFSVEFTKKPREVNAFLIDYDADTTEINPLTKLGDREFGFGNVSGLRTIEVRAIFDDGRYATYTCLADVQKTDEQDYGIPRGADSDIFAYRKDNDAKLKDSIWKLHDFILEVIYRGT